MNTLFLSFPLVPLLQVLRDSLNAPAADHALLPPPAPERDEPVTLEEAPGIYFCCDERGIYFRTTRKNGRLRVYCKEAITTKRRKEIYPEGPFARHIPAQHPAVADLLAQLEAAQAGMNLDVLLELYEVQVNQHPRVGREVRFRWTVVEGSD